jgi:perosamine synthetase
MMKTSNDLAILGGERVRNRPYNPYIALDDAAISKANEVLQSGLLSGFVARGNANFMGGPEVRELEKVLSEIFQVKYAVTVNSATSGLHAAMIAADIGPGDEVIVPPITMSATAASVMMCKATPIFADVEPNTYCIDTESVSRLISQRTKAIIAVNIFGLPAELIPLRDLADKNGLVLVEDNAQGPGARYKGRLAGTVGHMGVLSFNHHKAMHSGEGGAILTDDENFARRLQLARNHGEVVIDDWDQVYDYDTEIVGYNYRMTELQAALLVPQLRRMGELTEARVRLADKFSRKLAAYPFLAPVTVREECTHAYYLYPMRYSAELLGISRETFVAAMAAEGVHIAPYVKPIHHLPIFHTHRSANHPRFSRLFPGRTIDLFTPLEPCPVAVELSYDRLLVTNICRPPHTMVELEEFTRALDKVSSNVDALKKWPATVCNRS